MIIVPASLAGDTAGRCFVIFYRNRQGLFIKAKNHNKMDYEKKYKEALERARKYMDDGYTVLMPDLFPELRESEDDKMIDEIINTVTGYHPTHSTKEINEMVAWLKKQKKPTFISDLSPDDKGEPGENGILENQKEQKPVEWRDRLKDEIKHLKIDVYDQSHQFDMGARSSLTFLESFIDTLTEK
jgi:hypothetical protein